VYRAVCVCVCVCVKSAPLAGGHARSRQGYLRMLSTSLLSRERGLLRFAWFLPDPCSHLIVVMIRSRILLRVTLIVGVRICTAGGRSKAFKCKYMC
jgi:hypothetical protein